MLLCCACCCSAQQRQKKSKKAANAKGEAPHETFTPYIAMYAYTRAQGRHSRPATRPPRPGRMTAGGPAGPAPAGHACFGQPASHGMVAWARPGPHGACYAMLAPLWHVCRHDHACWTARPPAGPATPTPALCWPAAPLPCCLAAMAAIAAGRMQP